MLVVDPNEESAKALVQASAFDEGISVTQAATAKLALALLRGNRFDAVMVQFSLPDMEAREFCEAVRRERIFIPILVVGGESGGTDAIGALNAGATDYITRTFHASVLQARLRAHLRRFERSVHATFPVSHFIFQPGSRLLIEERTEEKTQLSQKETALLLYLCQTGDRVVPREELLREVWGQESGMSSRTIETHVYKLRRKIEHDPRKPEVLLTARNGYRLNPSPHASRPSDAKRDA